jgi:hypothetical protein
MTQRQRDYFGSRGTPRITGPQVAFLKRLANEAFVHLVNSQVDVHHLEGLSKAEASQYIDRLVQLKRAGWPKE